MNKALIFLLLFLLISGFYTGFTGKALSQVSGKETITAAELKAHLYFIASDELEGRETTKRGLNIAARYIASQLLAYGYKPIGDNGTYYQHFKVDVISVPGDIDLIVESGYSKKVLKQGKDFIIGQTPEKNKKFSGGLVFAGYGISAPELGWDDYANIDVKGKFVMAIMDKPKYKDDVFNKPENQKYLNQPRTALNKGAIGVIGIIPAQFEAQWDAIAPSMVGQEQMVIADTPQAGNFLGIYIPRKTMKVLLNLSVEEYNKYIKTINNRERINPEEVEGVNLSINVEKRKETRVTQNVVGVLEGSDPVLKNEYVVLGSHYDHLGARDSVVYNGADDDGSGTVALLEIAQAFALGERPKRSVLFVFHTGEEKGLLGSRYFTDHPLVPLEKISCQLNLDMIGRNGRDSIFVVGSDKLSSELRKINEEVNRKEIGMIFDYKYDAPDDPERIYYRSDHYMYARYGIPIIFYYSGDHPDYHRPTDTPDKCDYIKMQKVSRLVYLVAKKVANLDHMLVLDKDVKYRGKPRLSDKEGRKSITRTDLLAHLSFIASDELEGRETTKRGLKIAARYIASYLKAYGFKPVDKDRSYFQRFNVAIDKIKEGSKLIVRKFGVEKEFLPYKDFIIFGNFPEKVETTGGLVFAGYGIHYPELGWDDFSDIDINGKFVVIFSGIPVFKDSIFAKREYVININKYRKEYLKKHNAAGVIYVFAPRLERIWKRIISSGGRMKLPDVKENFKDYIPLIYVRSKTAGKILGLSEYEIKEITGKVRNGEKLRTYESFSTEVEFYLYRKRELKETQNVVGVFEGSDPVLKDQYVAFGAHYDHLGVRNGVVYNGADDDGSGTVALLEIAEAFSKGVRPKRSILMVFHTGEEKGLLGSSYFTDHPLVPLEKIDCMLNIDMIGRRSTDSLFIIGADRLSPELDKINREVNKEETGMVFDYRYNAPDDPNNFYRRSDHYMYARYGIPVIFYFSGTHEDYHRPTDDVEKINFEKFERVTRHIYSVGFKIANLDHMLKVEKGPKKRGKIKTER